MSPIKNPDAALSRAIRHTTPAISRRLMVRAMQFGANPLGQVPRHIGAFAMLDLAVHEGNAVAIDLLWPSCGAARTTQDRRNLLEKAVEKGHLEVARTLVALGCPVFHEATPLNTLMGGAAVSPPEGAPELIRWLTGEGLNPNGVAAEVTPLLKAIQAHKQNCLQVVRTLLESGADPTQKSIGLAETLRTPLHMAAALGGISVELWEILLAAGASLDATDIWGDTPVSLLKTGKQSELASAIQQFLAARVELARLDETLSPPLTTLSAARNRM